MSEQGRSIGGIYVPPGFKARGYCLFFPSLEMPNGATTQNTKSLYGFSQGYLLIPACFWDSKGF